MQYAQKTLPVGSVIIGSSRDRYSVEDVLGQGGFSVIYRVRDMKTRHNVYALKELFYSDKKQVRQLVFEFQLLTRINHPSLPRVYRFFEDERNSRVYVLMDYIEGDNLEHLRKRNPDKRMVFTRVISIIEPVAGAISYLHQQKPPVVHRDIKPANIIVPNSGESAYLVDFGTAKVHNEDTTTLAIRECTPGYGAPEQYSGGTSPRTDIYGLGATLYTLLTGEVPVSAPERMLKVIPQQSRSSIAVEHIPLERLEELAAANNAPFTLDMNADPLPPLQSLVAGVPDSVASAIHKAMSLRPEERFASVEEFWHALHVNAGSERAFDLEQWTARKWASTIEPDEETKETPVASTPEEPPATVLQLEPLASIDIPVQSDRSVGNGNDDDHNGYDSYHHGTLPNTPQPEKIHVSTGKKRFPMLLLLSLLLVVLCGVAFGEVYFTFGAGHVLPIPGSAGSSALHQGNRSQQLSTSPTSPATPQSMYPPLATQYSGTINDVMNNSTTPMTLSALVQQNATMRGNFIGLGLTGPFTGTITKGGHLQFQATIYQGNETIAFEGDVKIGGSIAGSFRILNSNGEFTGEYGVWSVSPATE